MNSPTVSVIMAAYKGAPFVGETIRSVIAQSFTDWELVIVDDCSPDDTLAVVRGFDDPRIRVLASPMNQGPVKTRNAAMAVARGRYLAGLDQDDVCLPERLARQVAYLDTHDDVVLVATAADLLEAGRVRRGPQNGETTPELIRWKLHLGNPLVWSSVMMRADVARKLDPITRPEMLFAEDFDLYHRIGAFGRIARIDEPLLLYRVHPGGVSKAFQQTMFGNAECVLSEVYRPIFGEGAGAAAELISRHLVQGSAIADRPTLDRMARLLEALRANVVERFRIDRKNIERIDRSISAIWWRLIRTSVRVGALPPTVVAHQRPAAVRKQDLAIGDMIVSSVIGGVRRIRF